MYIKLSHLNVHTTNSSAFVLLLTVRLVGSGLSYEGRLEVFYNGIWGTVCDDNFDDVDAIVACKSFGTGLMHYMYFRCRKVSLAAIV